LKKFVTSRDKFAPVANPGSGRDGGDGSGHPQRDQTDVSLRAERARADASARHKLEESEDQADDLVRKARDLADEVVQTARDHADREHSAGQSVDQPESEEARLVADGRLHTARSDADAALEQERDERRRYLAAFLAVEREATDADLRGERASADTAMAARDDFLANVSHDLRSLLTGLSYNAILAFKKAPPGPAGDPVRKHAETSQRLVQRMNRMVNDLLDVVSIEAGTLAILSEPVEVEKLLQDTLDSFEPIAQAKRITLVADGGVPPLRAELDGGRILQVLANMVSNAIKFTPPDGRVALQVRADRDHIHVTVRDTGIGIPPEALDKVFERFRQVSTDRRGLGLGLHISKSIVEAHGGRMWVESELGAGSTFHVTLPMRPAA
jgi:signal transduction histidine kinase